MFEYVVLSYFSGAELHSRHSMNETKAQHENIGDSVENHDYEHIENHNTQDSEYEKINMHNL